MSVIKPRAGVLGLLAMLLIGLFAAASANAQGPFFYHRELGAQGKGVKISNQQGRQWEQVSGSGGEAVLEGELGTTPIVISARQVQVKGIIYNNGLQGQAKLEFVYEQPTLTTPANSHCAVVVATHNIVKAYGHLVWKWDGSAGQLAEQPQQHQKPMWIFLGQEIQQGATALPTEVPFTSLTFKSSGGSCLLAAQANVTGSVAAEIKPDQLGAFSVGQTSKALPNGTLLHFWNGTSNNGAESKLIFNGKPAVLKQTVEANVGKFQETQPLQEIGIWGD